MSEVPTYDAEEAKHLRARYVVDRVDGRPLLIGHAACPRCESQLHLEPMGQMNLLDHGVRVRFTVACPTCTAKLEIQDEFAWGP